MLRKWRVWVCLALLVAGAIGVVGQYEARTAEAAEVADLQEQLEDGLKVRLPNEFRFVGNVVGLVKKDQLPMPLVKGTFQWARRKAGDRKYPFPYFERAMRIRAKRIGVIIP
jgi:hypothetical protein